MKLTGGWKIVGSEKFGGTVWVDDDALLWLGT